MLGDPQGMNSEIRGTFRRMYATWRITLSPYFDLPNVFLFQVDLGSNGTGQISGTVLDQQNTTSERKNRGRNVGTRDLARNNVRRSWCF